MSWISCFTKFHPVVKFYDSIILMIICLFFSLELKKVKRTAQMSRKELLFIIVYQIDSKKKNLRNVISFVIGMIK